MDPAVIARLRAVLGGEAPGGILESRAALDVAGIRALALQHGARFAVLDGPASKAELLGALHDGLAFPDYDGRNWDALEDLLGDPQASGGGPLVVVWLRPDNLPSGDSEVFRNIVTTVGQDRALVVVAGPNDPGEEVAVSRVPERIRQLGKVHHVALIVRDLDQALGFWRDTLGLPVELVLPIESDRVTIAFLPVGESKVELVVPTDDTTGVARFLATKGEGFHHVCFEVDNLAETLTRLELDGLELIDTAPRRGAEGPVAFIHPRSCHGVLVELIEAPGGPAWAALGF